MVDRKKIVLVGPVYPYKGGISHYTSLMYWALSKHHDVYMMSYKLQYPKFLFSKEQRDYSNDTFKIEETDYRINTINPFNWLSSAKKIRKLQPDMVIVQWWHPYFAPCYWSICKLLGNKKVLFVCHNVLPHERFPLDKFLARHTLWQGDCFIVQSTQDEIDLLNIKKDAVYRKTVHPTYNVFKLQYLSKEDGRKLLGYDNNQKLLLFFGFVREYKGLKYLLQAMPQVSKEIKNIKLLIVGDFSDDKENYVQLIKELKVERNIKIYDGYIPDKEVEKFFIASDLVVLPYESATQSGIVQIAYGFEKPVIATNVGGLPEVVINGKTGYIVAPKDSKELAESIIQFFKKSMAQEFQANIQKEAYIYSWDRMVEQIQSLEKECSI